MFLYRKLENFPGIFEAPEAGKVAAILEKAYASPNANDSQLNNDAEMITILNAVHCTKLNAAGASRKDNANVQI